MSKHTLQHEKGDFWKHGQFTIVRRLTFHQVQGRKEPYPIPASWFNPLSVEMAFRIR